MLYITTRNSKDIYTSHHSLCKDRGVCGGLYIPFQDIKYSQVEIDELKEKTFGQCVAHILNLFFSARLDGWDIDFCIGRYPVKLIPMSHKITIAEMWNNPDWDFARFVRNLRGRILGTADTAQPYGDWTWIAVRIAFLFGIFGELCRIGLVDSKHPIDVSVCTGDFSAPMALWYARKMGLPVGTIIFSCNTNSNAWELLHHGTLDVNASVIPTSTPMCDVAVPQGMERLIYSCLGENETLRFVDRCRRGAVYSLSEEESACLREGMFGAVIGENRIEAVIRNVHKTGAYLLGPYSALAYSGLQDYRATNAEAGPALILTERGPACDEAVVLKAMGIAHGE